MIKLASELPVRLVALASIDEINENRWYSHGATIPTCKSIVGHCLLIQSADLSYPIILDSNGRVMDGMHRVCKALMEGRPHVLAVQFQLDPDPDFMNRGPESLPYAED